MQTRDITARARAYTNAQRKIKEIQEKMADIKAELVAELTARETEELSAGGFTIRNTSVDSERFDTKVFKEKNPGIYETYLILSQSQRFTIT